MDFGENAAELTGEEMPPVSEFMKAVQKDGSVLCAEDIFKTTWTWLRERRCDHLVPTQIIEQYAMAAARWVQCEEYVSTYGFLAKRANGSVANSPYVNISREYMKQANNIWYPRLKCIANIVATILFLGFAVVVVFYFFQQFCPLCA